MSRHNSKYFHDKNHLSQAELLRYKEGTLPAAAMHKVEKHLLDCEMCSDALEGASTIENKEFTTDVNNIKRAYQQKFPVKKKQSFPIKWVIAASITILTLLAFGVLLDSGPIEEMGAEGGKVIPEKRVIVDNESVVAENIQDTIMNHHVIINDPVAPEVEMENTGQSKSAPLITESKQSSKESIVSSKKETEIIAMAENLPESKEEVVLEEAIEVNDSETNSDSEAPKYQEVNSRNLADVKLEEPKNVKLIKGRVVDEEGNPLPGVSVLIKGKSTGAVTDVDGNYQLPVALNDKEIVFNYIGFSTEEVAINGSQTSNVVLKPDFHALSEVVVTGYGTRSSSAVESENRINPKPAVGMRKYRRYIKENQKYPVEAKAKNIEGNVTLQFKVNNDGSFSDISVVKPLGSGLDEEAIRLLKEGPKWNPATVNGKPVSELVTIKIPFKIQKD